MYCNLRHSIPIHFLRSVCTLCVLLLGYANSCAQEVEDSTRQESSATIEKLKYKQQPGLALAASKIFFSDKRYSISGFGEFNYVPLQTDINRDLGDLELYYSGLYRLATFFGYRISDKLIWNSELQVEFLHDGTSESHYELVIEAFVDYLFKDYLKARVGFYPLTIGYVNNNDEPVMFYSVNRSEVERIILPSTWIEFGTMFYGNITPNWSYALGVSQGLNAENYLGGTWIRQGREIRLDVPKSVSVNPQINYSGIENLTLSASAYIGNSGQGQTVVLNQNEQPVAARISLGSAYAKYDWKNFRFVTVGTYGRLSDTDLIFELTKNETGNGQVLGSEVYGFLFELGCDILPYLRKGKEVSPKEGRLYNTEEMKLPLFFRYERLNTHQAVHASLLQSPRAESNMSVWTMGLNFNPRQNIVAKANYQYRFNYYEGDLKPRKHIVELGIGFIF
jgi:hypothetical protein